MLDHSRIRSGYDVEILISGNYLRRALEAVMRSDPSQLRQELGGGAITLELETPSRVQIVSDHIEVQRADHPPSLQPVDLIISLPVSVKFLTVRQQQTVKLYLRLRQVPQRNPSTGLVDRVDLVPEYVGMDGATMGKIQSVGGQPAAEAVEATLSALVARPLPPLAPAGAQKMAVRKLAAEPGRLACYALYINLPLRVHPTVIVEHVEPTEGTMLGVKVTIPDPNAPPVDRGDAAQGLNFSKAGMDLAIGLPQTIYDRLSRDTLHSYSLQRDDGTWWRPLLSGRADDPKTKVIGRLRDLEISARDIAPRPPLLPGMTPEQIAAIEAIAPDWRLRAQAEVTASGYDATQNIYLKPVLDSEGVLGWETFASEPKADLSLIDWFIGLGSLVLGLFLAPVTLGATLGILGAGAAAFITVHSIKEYYEGVAHDKVKSMTQNSGLTSALQAVPNRAPMVARRDDPLFYRAYEVVHQFVEANVRPDGMSFAAKAAYGTTETPAGARLVERQRQPEPDGELVSLAFEVPRPEEIVQPATLPRPWPTNAPNVYTVPVAEALARVTVGQAPVQLPLTPTHVRFRNGQIAEIRFDTGVRLKPLEAGRLALERLIWVKGYSLIRRRDGTAYFRGHPDGYAQNNLASLPIFSPGQYPHPQG